MNAPANDSEKPLVVLLGDSIRIGYQELATQKLAGRARVWAPEENGAHTAHTLARLETWLAEKKPAVVHINCGLHDMWRSEDGKIRHELEVYCENLRAIFQKIRRIAPDAEIVFALTTPVDQERQKNSGYGRIVRRDEDIPRYNDAARKVAEEAGCRIDDLFTPIMAAGKDAMIGPDGVHYSPAGYELLAQTVARAVIAALPPAGG